MDIQYEMLFVNSSRKMVFRLRVLLLAAAMLAGGTVSAQNAVSARALPRGFRNIVLGMSMDDVKKALIADYYFNYRGDPDVSLLPEPNMYMIECSGSSFISRAYFQFYDKKLYIINLALDRKTIDYYTMYTSLRSKYGDETRLSPEDAVWLDSFTRLSLERPLSVKYIDTAVFEKLKEGSRAAESTEMFLREKFIKEF